MRGAGKPEGTSWPVGPKSSKVIGIIHNGVAVLPDNSAFASSVSNMDQMVRNMVELVGLSQAQAIRVASLTPARILGIDNRKGALLPGHDADLVILDRALNVVETIVLGRTVFRRNAPVPQSQQETRTKPA
jgi:N-acetylglucosamine-6-phosphate deacetylase